MKIIPRIKIQETARGKRYTDNLIHIADAFSTNYYTAHDFVYKFERNTSCDK